MKNLYYHSAKEKGMWRAWLRYPSPGKHGRNRFAGQIEIVWMKKVTGGFSFHIGDRGSETPIDIMISFYWLAFFFGFNWGGLGALCEKIGRGHKRNISLQFHDRAMWWNLWYDDDMGYDSHHRCDKWRKPIWPWSMGRRKYRSWMCLREGSLDLNPIDAFWGFRSFKYEDLGERSEDTFTVGQFPGDEYKVKFTLKRMTRQRDFGPRWARTITYEGYIADWGAWDGGIPVRNDYWKGDCIYSSAVRVLNWETWLDEAHAALREVILRERKRYRYRIPTLEE